MSDGPHDANRADLDDQLLVAPLLDPETEAAVTAALAGLPEIELPDDVAQRIAAALAAELPLSGPVPAWAAGGETNVSVLPSQRERDQRRRKLGTRVLSGAAGLALVLGTIAVGTQFFNSSEPDTSSVAGGANPADAALPEAQGTLLTTSGASYTPADIDSRVTSLVSAASAPGAPLRTLDTETDASPDPSAGATSYSATDVVVDDTARNACVTKLVDNPREQPLAVDSGTWSGTPLSPSPGQSPSQSSGSGSVPAVVVVLTDDDPTQVAVFVVGAKCADASDLDAHVLYFAFVKKR